MIKKHAYKKNICAYKKEDVVYSGICLDSSTFAVSEIASRRWWCTVIMMIMITITIIVVMMLITIMILIVIMMIYLCIYIYIFGAIKQ